MRTSQGFSPTVSSGNGLFTLIGFMGMYFVMGLLFLFLIWREVGHGPDFLDGHQSKTPPSAKILPEGAGA
jgi:cytochrome d ubiquinol oxidase subunit I